MHILPDIQIHSKVSFQSLCSICHLYFHGEYILHVFLWVKIHLLDKPPKVILPDENLGLEIKSNSLILTFF